MHAKIMLQLQRLSNPINAQHRMTSSVSNARHMGIPESQHIQNIQHGTHPTFAMFTGFITKSSSSYILTSHGKTVLPIIYICAQNYPK
jgi:hypothetical protein